MSISVRRRFIWPMATHACAAVSRRGCSSAINGCWKWKPNSASCASPSRTSARRRPRKVTKWVSHGPTTTCACSRKTIGRALMATLEDGRPGAAPWLLSGPALLLFVGLLLMPLLLTLMLSFRVFSDVAGVTSAYTLANYWQVVSDPYYGTIFLRTGGLAFAVTLLSIVLGVPETIVLARMKRPWQSLCLLVVHASTTCSS